MGVVYIREIYKGVGLDVQTRAGKSEGTTARKFLVRVDNFMTTAQAIAGGVGIRYGNEHPALRGWHATDFSISCEDGSGLIWLVEVKYRIATPPDSEGLPQDEWSISSSHSLFPCFSAYKNPSAAETKLIVNSAGTPIEGLKVELPEITWQLSRSFKTSTLLMAAAAATNNTVNSAAWGGGAPKSWKCDFKSGQQRTVQSPKQTNPGDSSNEFQGADGEMEEVKYWIGVFEFRYSFSTWQLKPWDAGYMQKSSAGGTGVSLEAIKDKDGKPVKEQAMLDGSGKALAAGATPVALSFDIYRTADFAATFGAPPV